tara:strand:+ start:106 stop:321 length:216 start_codon:yes stop_codon:yes gene_type:complete
MAKLKERQFYNVSTRKTEMVPEEYIEIVKFKNGFYALLGYSKNDDKMFKIISELKLEKMEKKYGKAKKYKR